MYLSNYHTHSTFCDGRATPEAFVQEAIEKEFNALGFSAHAPLPFPTDWNMPLCRMDDYIAEISRLKQRYAPTLPIYIGLETDYYSASYNAATLDYATKGFDYLISSIHFITNPTNGKTMCVDGPYEEFREGVHLVFGGSIKNTIAQFFNASMLMVEAGGFDIIGHIDKIQMNGSMVEGFDPTDKAYIAQLRDLFHFAAEKGKIIEINTKSLNPRRILYPATTMLSTLKESNASIQINADSHHPSLLTDGYNETRTLLIEAGFKSTCELIGGKWQEVSI